MGGFFTRERFGEPQVIAGLLLLAFLGQGVWLTTRTLGSPGRSDTDEVVRIEEGLRQWHGQKIAGSAYLLNPKGSQGFTFYTPFIVDDHDYHSPLYYLIASAPLLAWHGDLSPDSRHYWGWLARAPYFLFGVLLGASVWYVARRLYGNAGGYIALALYCFAPGMIRAASLWHTQPEIGAAWGAFGTIFTAIAVAHTLYAPREVVLWNWRRIILLALSLALAAGSQFFLVLAVPLALGFMLYLAPTRKRAALVIWATACAVGFLVIFASYSFHAGAFWYGLRHARFLGVSWKALGMAGAYRQVAAQLGQISPALVLAIPVALITYFLWPRTRYFGNSAPLLVGGLFLLLAVASPHYPGLVFSFIAVPFLFVFVAGVFTDLLETKHRSLAMAVLWGLLGASALWNVIRLASVPRI